MPKFIMFVPGGAEAESGRTPTRAKLAKMGVYNDSLKGTGILETAQGLLSSSKGVRLGPTATSKAEDVNVTPGQFPVYSLVCSF